MAVRDALNLGILEKFVEAPFAPMQSGEEGLKENCLVLEVLGERMGSEVFPALCSGCALPWPCLRREERLRWTARHRIGRRQGATPTWI